MKSIFQNTTLGDPDHSSSTRLPPRQLRDVTLALLDIVLKLEWVKDQKFSLRNFISAYKRLFVKIKSDSADDDAFEAQLQDTQMFVCCPWTFIKRVREKVESAADHQRVLAELIHYAVGMLQANGPNATVSVLPSERFGVIRSLAVLFVLLDKPCGASC